MTDSEFDTFARDYGDRHTARLTRHLTLIGDVFYVGGPILGLVTRRRHWALIGLVGGAVLTSAAHLAQPGTLVPELRGIARHPLWSVRAEARRVAHLARTRPSATERHAVSGP